MAHSDFNILKIFVSFFGGGACNLVSFCLVAGKMKEMKN